MNLTPEIILTMVACAERAGRHTSPRALADQMIPRGKRVLGLQIEAAALDAIRFGWVLKSCGSYSLTRAGREKLAELKADPALKSVPATA